MNSKDEVLNKNRGDLYPIWLEEETRSMFDLSPVSVRRAVLECNNPSLYSMEQGELEEKIKPTKTDKKIKLSFWKEYDLAIKANRAMKTENICTGVCHPNYFRDHFLKNNGKVAWVFIPPNDYMMELETMMGTAADRLNEIMNIPIEYEDKDGRKCFNIKAAEIVLKAIKQIEDRVKGAPTQRQENRNLSIGIDASKPVLSEGDVDRKIAELEDKLKNTRMELKGSVEDAEIVED